MPNKQKIVTQQQQQQQQHFLGKIGMSPKGLRINKNIAYLSELVYDALMNALDRRLRDLLFDGGPNDIVQMESRRLQVQQTASEQEQYKKKLKNRSPDSR